MRAAGFEFVSGQVFAGPLEPPPRLLQLPALPSHWASCLGCPFPLHLWFSFGVLGVRGRPGESGRKGTCAGGPSWRHPQVLGAGLGDPGSWVGCPWGLGRGCPGGWNGCPQGLGRVPGSWDEYPQGLGRVSWGLRQVWESLQYRCEYRTVTNRPPRECQVSVCR